MFLMGDTHHGALKLGEVVDQADRKLREQLQESRHVRVLSETHNRSLQPFEKHTRSRQPFRERVLY